jgi:NADH:quinone reductase (non-electrogenic)
MTDRIVVLGAGYAGLSAAKRAAWRLRRYDARVTLVNARDHFVERVRLHQLAAGQSLTELPLTALLEGVDVDLVVARAIGLGSGADTSGTTGAHQHTYTLTDAEQAAQLRRRLTESASVAVVGGGLTGIEAATEIAARHPDKNVHLISRGRIAHGLSGAARRHLHDACRRLGLAVHEHTSVTATEANGLRLDDGRALDVGTIVWAAGFRVPDLAAASGLEVDECGRMRVDETLRSTSHPEILGTGDAAVIDGRSSAARMSCQASLPMGLQAGDRVADIVTGRNPRPVGIRYYWTNISIGRHDGVTQFTRPDDRPLGGAILTGRASARFKESITRATIWRIRNANLWTP